MKPTLLKFLLMIQLVIIISCKKDDALYSTSAPNNPAPSISSNGLSIYNQLEDEYDTPDVRVFY